MRTSHNSINSIYTNATTKLTDPVLLEKEFVDFFTSLMGEAVLVYKYPNAEVINKGVYMDHNKQA